MCAITMERGNMTIQSGAFLEKAIFLLSPAVCLLLLITYRRITDQPLDRDDVILYSKTCGIVTLFFLVGLIIESLFKWLF
jgi:hypothetical protein